MLRTNVIAVFILINGLIQSAYSQASIKSVKAVRTTSPKIDGIFKNKAWQTGGMATGFVQMNPDEGELASEQTATYFLYDDEFLYIGVQCFDKEPGKIINQLGSYDNQGNADYISIYIDTFHDHRNAYCFGISVAGTKSDGKWYADNKYDVSWNGVWWAEASITDKGWIAEFKIPFSTMKFENTGENTWGLNIQRVISRKNEIAHWQPVKRDDGKRVSMYGHLEGLLNINPGMNLEILPYVTSRGQADRMQPLQVQNENGIAGVDVQYGITTNLNATLTVNPDFAQIEADEDLINLTRYPLYLPEKRPFFTEGASIFNTTGNYRFFNIYTAPFYSRRINEPVYGLKINGKLGSWDVGVLHSYNDNDMGINRKIALGTLPEETKPKAYYNIVRMSKDIFSKSQLGLIAMSKEYSGKYSRYFGIDGHLRFNNFYEFLFEGIGSKTDEGLNNEHSILTELTRRTDFWSFKLRYREQTPGYQGNDIGFYKFSDFREAFLWIQVAPRLERIGIRRFIHNINAWAENYWGAEYFQKKSLTRWWIYVTHVQLMNYWMISGYFYRGKEFDRVDQALYPVDSFEVAVRNNPVSKCYFRISHHQGKYRTGYSYSYNNSVQIKASDRFNIELAYNRSLAKLIDPATDKLERFNYEVFRSKFSYHYNRDLNARLILQYSGMEKRLDAYFLLAYNFRPKSFLYIAYTERFDDNPYYDKTGLERFPHFGSSNKVFQVKLSYLFLN